MAREIRPHLRASSLFIPILIVVNSIEKRLQTQKMHPQHASDLFSVTCSVLQPSAELVLLKLSRHEAVTRQSDCF
eukprot:1423465-Rhodomonas_salina.2